MRFIPFILLSFIILSCADPEPRMWVQKKSGSFFKESIERNKQILKEEESIILSIIQKDSLNQYFRSADGFWYTYEIQNQQETYLPQPDDLVTLKYSISDLKGTSIYSEEDIGELIYKVDKQELFTGLRNAIKLLKQGEKGVFYFPSSLAYGYPGDSKKIGINFPLKATISILDIETTNSLNQTINYENN